MNRVIMLLSNPFKPDLRVLRESLILSKNEFQVIIVAWDREGKLKSVEKVNDKVVVVRIKLPYRGRGFFLLRFLRRVIYTILFNLMAITYVREFLKKQEVKIVHCHDFDTIIAGLLIKYFSLRPEKKFLILDSHEYWPGIPFLEFNSALKNIVRSIHNVLIKLVDAVITVSSALSGRLPSPLRGIKVIFPNIYLPEEIVHLKSTLNEMDVLGGKRIKIFYYGALHKARGIIQLIKLGILARRANRLSLDIIIAGKGPLERLVRMASHKGVLKYLGWISESDIRGLLENTHFTWILYDPKIENNQVAMPNKFFLSLLYGIPIITNDGLFVAELVKDAKIGLVVNYNRADEEVYQKLIELFGSANESKYKEIRENVNKMFNKLNAKTESYIDNFLKLYLAIAQK